MKRLSDYEVLAAAYLGHRYGAASSETFQAYLATLDRFGGRKVVLQNHPPSHLRSPSFEAGTLGKIPAHGDALYLSKGGRLDAFRVREALFVLTES